MAGAPFGAGQAPVGLITVHGGGGRSHGLRRRLRTAGRILIAAALWPLWALAPIPPAQAEEPPPFVLAVEPFLPPPEIRQRFGPLAQYLAEKLGRSVMLRIEPGTEERVAASSGGVDLAYLGAARYIRMADRFGPRPLLARIEISGKPTVDGVVVVRKDSSVRTLADLRGKRFAFGEADSTLGSIMPRYALLEAGLTLRDLASYAYVASRYDLAMGVLQGQFDAGVLRRDVYDAMASRGLRSIADLAPASEGVFVARAGLPAAELRRLRRSLLQLRSTVDGQRILQAISDETTGLVRTSDEDFADLRRVLQKLERDGG